MRCRGVLSIILSSSLLMVAMAATNARAEAPRGGYIFEPEAPKEDGGVLEHASNLIFLNPCWGGCRFTRGWPNDSRTNRASVLNVSSANVSEFQWGQASWDAVVQCVREMYEPFGVEITDQDPGSTPHYEAVVAGSPDEIGQGSNTGGIAPFTCGIIDNAVTFSFANIYGGSVQQICEVVAQETAHAWGLEHEYLCEDPMTYLPAPGQPGCGAKKFRDVNARCGEYSERNCDCGGSTQNSVQMLTSIFGTGQPSPPEVQITQPADGAEVQPGFVVRSNITDNVQVMKASLWINGQMIQEILTPPYVFNAPVDLAEGALQVEVRAEDNRGDIGKHTITAILGDPCSGANDCPGADTCVDGRCVPGPGETGGLGEPCDVNEACSSGLCGSDGTNKFCTESCAVDANGCPNGFDCLPAGGTDGVCWPNGGSKDPSTGGCSTSGNNPAPLGIVLLFGAFLMVVRRKRC
jgi:hypothetical protein